MRRQGGGFGVVMLLVVVAIILLIATKNWKSVAPTALEIQKRNRRVATPAADAPEGFDPSPPPSASSEAWNPSPPARPSLSGMEQRTTAHTDAVQDALRQAQ
jgi:hypothetical protein